MLCDIVFHPVTENGVFKDEYVTMEKENLKQIIEGKIDNKAKYALDRCIEEMYQNKPYGLYKYGYVEDLETITPQDLYHTYTQMIQNAKIDIFVSGKIKESEIQNIILENQQIKTLDQRKQETLKNELVEEQIEPNELSESMDITQGKLVMGLQVKEETLDDKYITLVYNTILGGGANSKLFQNVREKASLAYTAASNYIRQKSNIFIRLRN